MENQYNIVTEIRTRDFLVSSPALNRQATRDISMLSYFFFMLKNFKVWKFDFKKKNFNNKTRKNLKKAYFNYCLELKE